MDYQNWYDLKQYQLERENDSADVETEVSDEGSSSVLSIPYRLQEFLLLVESYEWTKQRPSGLWDLSMKNQESVDQYQEHS